MLLRWLLGSLHLIALGIGLGAVWVRGRALKAPADPVRLATALRADTAWGLAALLWIVTGLARAFGPFEKGLAFYLQSEAFWTKMALLAVVLLLELWPMVVLIRWRIALARGGTPDLTAGGRIAAISFVQAGLVIGMVFAAVAMARGLPL